mmetsp:Transcript_34025/g.92126  ORF Transcript_34025/g.92126 Transcript_34025/m.92126 type:complete len:80 (-) Transcript_34025:185-424(-)
MCSQRTGVVGNIHEHEHQCLEIDNSSNNDSSTNPCTDHAGRDDNVRGGAVGRSWRPLTAIGGEWLTRGRRTTSARAHVS